jgi:hypothetical protein
MPVGHVVNVLLAVRQPAKVGFEVCRANGETRSTPTLGINRLRLASESS